MYTHSIYIEYPCINLYIYVIYLYTSMQFNFKLDLYKIIILTNYVHYNFNKFSNIALFYLIFFCIISITYVALLF